MAIYSLWVLLTFWLSNLTNYSWFEIEITFEAVLCVESICCIILRRVLFLNCECKVTMNDNIILYSSLFWILKSDEITTLLSCFQIATVDGYLLMPCLFQINLMCTMTSKTFILFPVILSFWKSLWCIMSFFQSAWIICVNKIVHQHHLWGRIKLQIVSHKSCQH